MHYRQPCITRLPYSPDLPASPTRQPYSPALLSASLASLNRQPYSPPTCLAARLLRDSSPPTFMAVPSTFVTNLRRQSSSPPASAVRLRHSTLQALRATSLRRHGFQPPTPPAFTSARLYRRSTTACLLRRSAPTPHFSASARPRHRLFALTRPHSTCAALRPPLYLSHRLCRWARRG